jgi:hypothetical protein
MDRGPALASIGREQPRVLIINNQIGAEATIVNDNSLCAFESTLAASL